MDYVLTIFKKQGEPLYALWIDSPDVEPQPGMVWQTVQAFEFSTEEPISAVLCGLLLMSEATSDILFREAVDTWLGPTDDDLLDNYAEYASREEAKTMIDKESLRRLEGL